MGEVSENRCSLLSVNNLHEAIQLPNNIKKVLGRSCETKITDTRCSRKQVSLIANSDGLEVIVQQIGDNSTGVNGVSMTKNETRVLKHGDILELLLGKHTYRVVFEKVTLSKNVEHPSLKRQHNSSDCESDQINGMANKKIPRDPFTSSASVKGTWETIDHGKLLIYTPFDLAGRSKIAAYDVDHTVITTKTGNVFPKDIDDWKIAYSEVPGKLKKLWSDGYKIIFLTNQAGIAKGKLKPNDFKSKVCSIISKLGIPIQTFVSTGSGVYRKPAPGMWNVLMEQKNDNVQVDIHNSFYCGDAAGRVVNWAPKKKKDFSSSDRLFALNIGLKFYTPEEHFLGHAPGKFTLPDFNPSSLSSDMPLCEPHNTLVLQEQEVVILVGYPGSGKSFFSKTHMVPAGYYHVNRDTLGSWQQCISATESALKSGKSVIVDNTNPNKESRNKFIEIAKKMGIVCRCFILNTSKEHSKHNNRFREYTDESHEKVNDIVINMYKSKYEEPTLEEGFKQVVNINFVPKFANQDLEKLYRMYLLENY